MSNIVQDVLALFRAAGFEVREPSALDPEGQFAIVGSLDAAGILVESVLEYVESIERRQVQYPPVEEVLGFQVVQDPALAPGQVALRPPQAEVLRHMPAGPVADTMDHAQLAALGAMIRQR